MVRRCLWIALALAQAAAPALAADMAGPVYGGSAYGGPVYGGPPASDLPPTPRYFPRGDGSESVASPALPPRRVVVACTPRRVPVPTNAPDDPSYVGSPYGRSLLPYCR